MSDDPRAVAINVGANSTLPGVRGPIDGDGRFTYLPIPEREPVAEPVPTYADLDLSVALPADVRDRRVHLDPEFATYPCCSAYTYGDEHGVKAGPLSALSGGDYVFFYATLDTVGEPADWMPTEWGAYVIGQFRLDRDPVTGDGYMELPTVERDRFRNNAHLKRATFDAKVLVSGDPDESALYDRAVPLSTPAGGTDANRLVTDLFGDSGKGPWWRRVMQIDPDGTADFLDVRAEGPTAFRRQW